MHMTGSGRRKLRYELTTMCNIVLLINSFESEHSTFLILLICHIVGELRYVKFKDNDNNEIYHTYNHLFGGSCDFMKYILTSTKLSQRGFELGFDTDTDDLNDKLPINVKTTDSNDSPTQGRTNSSINIFLCRSEKKRKGKHVKGKRKKFGAREAF